MDGSNKGQGGTDGLSNASFGAGRKRDEPAAHCGVDTIERSQAFPGLGWTVQPSFRASFCNSYLVAHGCCRCQRHAGSPVPPCPRVALALPSRCRQCGHRNVPRSLRRLQCLATRGQSPTPLMSDDGVHHWTLQLGAQFSPTGGPALVSLPYEHFLAAYEAPPDPDPHQRAPPCTPPDALGGHLQWSAPVKLTALPSPPPAAYGCPYVLPSIAQAGRSNPAALPARLIPTSLAGGGFPLYPTSPIVELARLVDPPPPAFRLSSIHSSIRPRSAGLPSSPPAAHTRWHSCLLLPSRRRTSYLASSDLCVPSAAAETAIRYYAARAFRCRLARGRPTDRAACPSISTSTRSAIARPDGNLARQFWDSPPRDPSATRVRACLVGTPLDACLPRLPRRDSTNRPPPPPPPPPLLVPGTRPGGDRALRRLRPQSAFPIPRAQARPGQGMKTRYPPISRRLRRRNPAPPIRARRPATSAHAPDVRSDPSRDTGWTVPDRVPLRIARPSGN
ncbi:hypothetical protein PCL_09861 [Purpureocillium lilacinum]|uniref:Uncharacterized protein n=1 Tax=Purpureocillium lilacinum TaxID=33203 RepID=A0A2U3EEB1_PURLI|nr:hypothetical protein PCL_09861 [Purpureocillium lilacinum]